ncbi:MAG: tetratricopeptide repeat protein [Pseudomonadota bacterium]|nr:tetratricopeptide repeat protein [Pseudomonadota bacterium]
MPLIENLQAMLARGQDGALLRFGLGSELLKLGQGGQAVEHLRKALEFDPQYSAAWKLLGRALAESGHRDEAIQAYRDGIDRAERKGDLQAVREMRVFLGRLTK